MSRRSIRPGDKEWPTRLDRMGPLDPPHRLRLQGLPLVVPEKTVAIVGTRHPTASGIDTARSMTRGLVEAGFTIVSGMAMGIDSIAHRTTLEMGGYTVAVLGCGLAVDYPIRNRSLREQIVEHGTLVSEYQDDAAPTPFTFPRRNRIIAGLSEAVVFIEGGEKSGGKITAKYSLDMGRHVFAVPGNVRSRMAAGPNGLIRQSEATLVTCAHDVLDELAPGLIWRASSDPDVAPRLAALDQNERVLLRYLEEDPVKPERIRKELDMNVGETALALARLESRGWVLRRSGGFSLSETGVRMQNGLEETPEL